MTKDQHRRMLDVIIKALQDIRADLHNRKPLRGRITAPATAKQRHTIRALHASAPELSMQEISQQLGISIGRVSETLRGKRK